MAGSESDGTRDRGSAPGTNPETLDRLRRENAALKLQLSQLQSMVGEIGALRADIDEALKRNEQQQQEKRSLDREIIELRSTLSEAERELAAIRQTFIYRTGEVIISAKTWKGLRRVPGRLLALRRAFLDNRRTARPAGGPAEGAAERLRYVDKALDLLAAKGLDAAVAHVRARPGGHAMAKARALVEIAHSVRADQPARAGQLGAESAALNPGESRLRALILALFEQGEVTAPAAILDAADDQLMAAPADHARASIILAHRRQIASPMAFRPARPAAGADADVRIAVVSPRAAARDLDPIGYRAQAVLAAYLDAGRDAVLVTPPCEDVQAAEEDSPCPERLGAAVVLRLASPEAPEAAYDEFVTEAGGGLAAHFERRRITQVHAMAGTTLAPAALWAARQVGAKFILDVGATPDVDDPTHPNWEASERFKAGMSLFAEVVRASDAVILRSGAIADSLSAQGLPVDPLVIEDVAPSVFSRASAPAIAEVRRALGLAEQRLIGVFEPSDDGEGLADVVRALPRIREAATDAVVLFCGSGRHGLSLTRLAARLGVEAQLNADGVLHGRPAACLSALSTAVFPRWRGGSARQAAAFELQAALAIGAPVVAADSAWARDWIENGMNGLLVEAGDVDGLAQAITSVLTDSALAARLAAAGQAVIGDRASRKVIDPRIVALLDGGAGPALDEQRSRGLRRRGVSDYQAQSS